MCCLKKACQSPGRQLTGRQLDRETRTHDQKTRTPDWETGTPGQETGTPDQETGTPDLETGTPDLQKKREFRQPKTDDNPEVLKQMAIAWALVRFGLRLVPAGWYRRLPFLPIPPPNYVKWRLRTAYGKHRPGWMHVIRDMWQFGEWLRTFDKT